MAAIAAMACGDVPAAEEDLYFSSLPVVATVSRLPQATADAPGAVTVLDRELIRQSGIRQVSDLLRLVPGFFVTPHNQDAPRVAYHGLSNEANSPRVQVLVDGRSQYSPLFRSGVNWNLLPVAIEDIERIEVIRGSNSAAYGSNAFMGVINIITQDASQARGWMFAANHGNQSVRDETLRWGGKMGEADVRFTYQQQGDGGLRLMENGGTWIDPHDSRHAQLFDLRADLALNDRDELRFSLSQASDISQFGRPNDTSDVPRDFSQSSTAFNLGWRRALSGDEEVKLLFSRVEDWGSDRYQARDSGFRFNINNGGRSATTELELQHLFVPWTATRLVWGLGISDSRVRSTRQFFTNDDKLRQVIRLFGNLEWRPTPAWLVNLGANLGHDSLSGGVFDPRASISYHVNPEHTLRVIAARAHRTPSMSEARGDSRDVALNGPVSSRNFLYRPGLDAEQMDTLEAGYLAEFSRLRASLDVRLFHERLPNRIQLVPYALTPPNCEFPAALLGNGPPYNVCGRADTALNGEKVSIRGYEYQARWQPFDSTRLLFSHAYIVIGSNLAAASLVADNGDNVDKISRHTRESAPAHSSSAMLTQVLPFGLEASVMYYKVGFMRWTRNSFVHAFERVDWRLAYPFKAGPTRGEVAYTAQASNGSHDGLRDSRIVTETHWLSLRINY
ncbi:MAG TPA: TonB-dependent receptor [Rhodocyclaceae bacterium]|nr:TonB-dependent receptor [Rhodocyclaceae bacterium]